jgi:glycosyltransferase involved in cell wall biosynthesis
MRLDALILLYGALALLIWSFFVPAGPLWPVGLSVGSTLLFAIATRPSALPRPSVVRPAVLIPTHNNAGEVGKVVAKACKYGLPVYVVDDGSQDTSGKEAEAAGAILLTHPVNRGKGIALLTGMARIEADGLTHAICLDADGQHDPDDIPGFTDSILKEPWAIWVGVRDLSTAPGKSRFGRSFSNFWIRMETGWVLQDTQCGFRCYPVAAVLALPLSGSRYDLEVEVLTRSLWGGLPVRDRPCRVYYPPPEERVTSFAPIKDNIRISLMNTKLVLERILWPGNWWVIRQHER